MRKSEKYLFYVKNYVLEISELFQHFNNLVFTEIQFDEYILKADCLLEDSLKEDFEGLFEECLELIERK